MAGPGFTSERRLLIGIMAAFLAMALLAAIDVVSDVGEGTPLSHVAVESVILFVGLVGAAVVARKLMRTVRYAREQTAEAERLADQLEASAAEAERWRSEARELMRGLGEAIDEQFERWQLSDAEKEVALLLLKGLSHKDIAAVRSVTEATTRQQARAVYRKAGLTGRHDLAAFFLEDLMLPAKPPDS